VVDLGIFPAVPEITRKGVIHREAVSEEDPESAGRKPVVLVNLRNALREVVHDVVDRVVHRHVDERPIRKNALDLPPKTLIKPIIVVDVEKTAACEILAEPRDLGVTELDVAVPRDVKKRVVPQLVIHQRDARFRLIHLE
jgi:hypothetical protein